MAKIYVQIFNNSPALFFNSTFITPFISLHKNFQLIELISVQLVIGNTEKPNSNYVHVSQTSENRGTDIDI